MRIERKFFVVIFTFLLVLFARAGQQTVPMTMYDHAEPVKLPQLMRNFDGSPVEHTDDWERKRRPELLDYFAKNVYGERPVERPADLTFAPVGADRAFPEADMVRKQVRLSFSGPRGKGSFVVTAFLPRTASAAKPVPAFVLICNRALEQYADLERRTKSEFFPPEEIVRRGYAVVLFKNTEIAQDEYFPSFGPDGTCVLQDPPFTNDVYACWAPERTEHSWGAISAWAWGASRVLDWIETVPAFDAKRVAIVGHSRGGKTALWAAASDRRFAMACVNDSGCCGAKLNHVALPFAETIQQDNAVNPHWFCRAFRRFNGQDAYLPYDQHWIAALVAPRLLYIASASEDTDAGPWGEFLTARHASPAWRLYGVRGLVENHPYRIGDPFHEGCVGYHLRQGKHDLNLFDWRNFMDFADRHGWGRSVPGKAADESVGLRLLSYNIGHGLDGDGRPALDEVVRKIEAAKADFVGLQDVDWHARRSGRVEQASEIGRRCGFYSSFTTDHFIGLTPDEQHGLAILSREKPLSQVIRTLPSSGKGKALFLCEFTDCYVGVTEFDADAKCRADSRRIVEATVRELEVRKPVFLVDDGGGLPIRTSCVRDIRVKAPALGEPAVVPAPSSMLRTGGFLALQAKEPAMADVRRRTDAAIPSEGYRLTVSADGIEVVSSDEAGAFYALQTLKQLGVTHWGRCYLPCCEIADAPRFGWRGMMIDDARHFFGFLAMRRTLDLMAFHKLNVLHWHLTDDEGWRVPIRGLEAFARVGAVRASVGVTESLADRDEGRDYGPYAYTREEIGEIVRYAKARHIRIVPEVDLPGHCRMALKAYPDLGCFPNGNGAPEDAVDNVLCLGDERTFETVKGILDGLCELFPDSEMIHVGGDEANRANWDACPKCRARKALVGARDGAGLQADFTARMAAHLKAKGRRLVGWDEILAGGMAPEGTVVMSWRGAEGGVAASKAGRSCVMCPHTSCYYNYSQCLKDDPFAYPWWSIPLSLEKAHAYDPLAGIPETARGAVLGGQCCLWSNMIPDEPELQWKAWPRACATAEVFWSENRPGYEDFLRRMRVHRPRLLARHVNCAPLE